MKGVRLSVYLGLVLFGSHALVSTVPADEKKTEPVVVVLEKAAVAKVDASVAKKEEETDTEEEADKGQEKDKKQDHAKKQAEEETKNADDSENEKDKSENESDKPEWEQYYDQELAKLNFEKAQLEHKKDMLELEYAISEAEQQKKLAEIEAERHRVSLENDLTEQLVRKEQLNIELRKVKPDYLLEPYQNGQLYISDRRITLNGPIYAEITDELTYYIHYYNNKSTEYPIFLVIDRCPGGSVMEGARIIEAMQNSKAPVYVVVKSMAISMCAVITTLAKRSFAYPNAVILHHQMSGLYYGNNTQISERMKLTEEWSNRLMKPIAAKMGVTLDAFVKSMYTHNTEGNWLEFANDAQKLHWVDYVVSSIHETSYIEELVKEEEETAQEEVVVLGSHLSKPTAMFNEKHQLQVYLPPLGPGDFYHLYDPYGMYKVAN